MISQWPRSRHRGTPVRRAAAGIVAVAAAVPSLGCQSETPQPPSQTEPSAAAVVGAEAKAYAPGELATARDYTMSVESVEPCAVPPPFTPKRGYEKLGVEVVIEGTSNRQVPANPFYATLKDSTGMTYASTLAGCRPPLEASLVTVGQKARGIVTFEVPISANKLEMSYAPAIIGGGRQEVRFDLRQ